MTKATIAELQDRNKRLLALVVGLSRIILDRIGGPASLADGVDRRVALEVNEPTRWLEAASTLREAAIQCAHLARDSFESEPAAARELEEVSIELAEGAATLEGNATRSG